MRARVGDRLVVRGHVIGEHERDAEVLEVRGPDGTPPFVVRWSDSGHETLLFPGPDSWVQHLGGDEVVAPAPSAADALRTEHHELLAGVQALLDAADALDEAPDLLPDEVHETYAWLTHELVPRTRAASDALYPVVEHAAGERATVAMRRQQEEIDRLVARLGRLRDEALEDLGAPTRRNLRQVLHALHAILTLHFATEEELYVPLLEGAVPPALREELTAVLLGTGAPSTELTGT